MKTIKKTFFAISAAAVLLCVLSKTASAQLSQMGALYFQNQYLGNPAMAGFQGLNINLGYGKQWSGMPGSPSIQAFTADYAITAKAGVGINVYNDKSGLLSRTRTVGTYAYHLPLAAEAQQLSFGISLGFMRDYLSTENMRGDEGDIEAVSYNARETYVDGDFGIAYTSDKWNIQAAIPNLKGTFNRDLADGFVNYATFFSAISYRFHLAGAGLEPKAAYRMVKGADNILDAGANFTFVNNRLNLLGMYHSTGNTTFGLGMNYQALSFIGMYSTATSALSNYANGTFEVGLKMRFGN